MKLNNTGSLRQASDVGRGGPFVIQKLPRNGVKLARLRCEWYGDFEAATGYGTGEGLGGWNCRHGFYPFWPGLSVRNYTDEQLAAMNEASVPYNGKLHTRYEINQMQRALERKVRSAKRKYLAESEAGVDASRSAVRLKAARQQLSEFIRSTGGRADSSRTSVAGFGRSAAGKATATVRYTPIHESRQKFRQEVTIWPPMRGDAITHRSIFNDLNRSPVGRKALDLILSGDYDIQIDYTDETPPNLMGYCQGHHIVVFAKNTKTIKSTANTLIHELTHASEKIGGDQWAEARCISAEWLHRKGTLTTPDLRAIVKLSKELYPDKPWRKKR